jgi:hypothetical protein
MLCQVGGTFDRAASAEARRTAAPAPLTCPLSHENHTPSGRLHHPGPAGHGFETASGANWVHEIKHDGYRMIVRRDGPKVRLYSRNAYDWTARLPAIAGAAERIEANSFTIDGEAVVVGPDGLSRFEELRRREAAHKAILYAFDLIEHDGEDLRDRPFLDRKPRWRDCCAISRRASCSTNTSPGMALWCSNMPAGLALKASSRSAPTAHLSIRSVSGLDQGPPSREHRGAAGAQRELE